MPEAYGTKELLVAARDPRCLYVRWDLTAAQQRRFQGRATSGQLRVLIHAGAPTGPLASEIHLRPEMRHGFVAVEPAGGTFVAELGYFDQRREWVSIAVSAPVTTPPDAVSEDKTVRFAALTPGMALGQLADPHRSAPLAASPLVTTVGTSPTDPPGWPAGEWTEEREVMLAEVLGEGTEPPPDASSGEIAELMYGELGEAVPGPAAGAAPGISRLEIPGAGVSSPAAAAGGEAPGRDFWFNIDAELIIYGATEPGATVTLGGLPVQLRPDGTFSCHFALPDGEHELEAVAVSAQGDTRRFRLRFSRRTE